MIPGALDGVHSPTGFNRGALGRLSAITQGIERGTMPYAARPGAIVLAAYQPDPILFARQLRSLQSQTVADWECVISVDGESEAVFKVVAENVGDDPRFRIVADGTRLGFYLNFERGLREALPGASWIALCDQDDHWYPEKLETLLPHLEDVALVSGQARLVTYPDDVTTGYTRRRDLGASFTLLSNQFTGSLCVLRADLARLSLPFPQMSTRAAAHDHWMAALAGASGGTRIVDQTVQDYVQHASNVFGDPSRMGSSHPLHVARTAVRNATAFTRRYENSATPAAALRMLFKVYVGWRQLLADEARDRVAGFDSELDLCFASSRRLGAVLRLLREARRAGFVERRFVAEYLASWGAGALVGGRRSVRELAGSQRDEAQEISEA